MEKLTRLSELVSKWEYMANEFRLEEATALSADDYPKQFTIGVAADQLEACISDAREFIRQEKAHEPGLVKLKQINKMKRAKQIWKANKGSIMLFLIAQPLAIAMIYIFTKLGILITI